MTSTGAPGTEAEGSAESDIAVIAMEGRFPRAPTMADFWDLLKNGREAIRPVSDADFLAAGGLPSSLTDPHLVRVESTLDDIDLFDAEFFGFQPTEARLLDPQQRVFIECAYHLFEQAGYVPAEYGGLVGVYAGASQSKYYLDNVHPLFAGGPGTVDGYVGSVANASSALVTRVSYLLNLTGPSVALQTSCSTSLVAVHTACQDLLEYRCDMAIAGGASINPSARLGYRHVPGGPFSPDGHCRPYSADAAGMSPGDGVGLVLLKRLPDALADGDHIRSVIRGTAVNNDGSRKIGFTAPSVKGQRDVIVAAQAVAGVSAEEIGFVEGHGTGTPVGDPIELTALTKAFAFSTARTGFCALGSVKSNIGHLDAAAGIASLIKTILALENEAIPPTLHFNEPNELIEFDKTSFFVADSLRPWPRTPVPRMAGVSSFGIGGTNAHVVVQEAPLRKPTEPDGRSSVVLLSAASPKALADLGRELGEHVDAAPDTDLVDLAHTLQCGRKPMRVRRAVVADSTRGLGRALADGAGHLGEAPDQPRDVVFVFPGAGSQYQRMGQQLYEHIPVFRREMDRCARVIRAEYGQDLLHTVYPPGKEAPRRDNVDLTALGYAAIVSTEWALTRVLDHYGVRPSAMIGHSLGEYTAACVAGVMELEEMLPLVTERERLIRKAGGMTLSVLLDESEIHDHLIPGASLAGVNAPGMCTVSGPDEAILEMERRLAAERIDHHRLRVPGAVHSSALDPVLDELRGLLSQVNLREPRIPILSNVTGKRLEPHQATDPDYWVRHTRSTVRFRDGLRALPTDQPPALVEAGPSAGLTKLAEYTLGQSTLAVPAIRHAYSEETDKRVLHNGLARLWAGGAEVGWAEVREGRSGHRVPLPGYPFQRRSHWVPAADRFATTEYQGPERSETSSLTARQWRGSGLPDALGTGPVTELPETALVVLGRGEPSGPVRKALADAGTEAVFVRFGEGFERLRADSFLLDPQEREQVDALRESVWPDGGVPEGRSGVLDISALVGSPLSDPLREVSDSARFVEHLIAGIGESDETVEIVVAGRCAFGLAGTELVPEQRLVQAHLEHRKGQESGSRVRVVDLEGPLTADAGAAPVRALMRELARQDTDDLVAHRNGSRWVARSARVEPPRTGSGTYPDAWIVPGGLRESTLRHTVFLSQAVDAELISVEPGTEEGDGCLGLGTEYGRIGDRLGVRVLRSETGGPRGAEEVVVGADREGLARPGLFWVMGQDGDSAAQFSLDAVRRLWERRAEPGYSAVVLVDPVAGDRTLRETAVGCYAQACVESANAEGLPWRLLRWRQGPEWTGIGELFEDGGDELSARARLGAQALSQALRASGPPVLDVSAGSGRVVPSVGAERAADPVLGGDEGAADSVQRPARSRSAGSAERLTETERRVAQVWREAFGIDDIGKDENFFELGGESLLLMRIVAKLRDHYVVDISIRQLYVKDRLTISGVAIALEEKISSSNSP